MNTIAHCYTTSHHKIRVTMIRCEPQKSQHEIIYRPSFITIEPEYINISKFVSIHQYRLKLNSYATYIAIHNASVFHCISSRHTYHNFIFHLTWALFFTFSFWWKSIIISFAATVNELFTFTSIHVVIIAGNVCFTWSRVFLESTLVCIYKVVVMYTEML